RLSSIEPLEFSPELIDVLAAHAGRICRHLHIPLQSGSDRVLAAMNRRYTAEQYASIVGELARRIPGLALGADVLTGFPGETDDDHARTCELVRTLPLAYLHVFSYSPRDGTAAAYLPGPVRPDIIKRRSRELLAWSANRYATYLDSLVGTEQSVLFERQIGEHVVGHTDTYAEVSVPAGEAERNDLAQVRIDGVTADRCFGHVIGSARLPLSGPGSPPSPSAS
ncbi:MAG TPA: radical SAM protein, partial [Armatimonadota bacterium]|nr:radical SAM protein [Armatimonadota bacterium]